MLNSIRRRWYTMSGVSTNWKHYFYVLGSLFILNISCQSADVTKEDIAYVDYVCPQLDSENSRWFFFSSACRPFGMVNLSPDTEIDGAWGSGYRYKSDTIQGLSHIHAWQLPGLSVMPIDLGKIEVKA